MSSVANEKVENVKNGNVFVSYVQIIYLIHVIPLLHVPYAYISSLVILGHCCIRLTKMRMPRNAHSFTAVPHCASNTFAEQHSSVNLYSCYNGTNDGPHFTL